jgi:hypothetical protein
MLPRSASAASTGHALVLLNLGLLRWALAISRG